MSQILSSPRAWLYGLAVAVISAVANAGTMALGAPDFVLDHWREMLPMLAVAALREVFLYLRRSPLPGAQSPAAVDPQASLPNHQ